MPFPLPKDPEFRMEVIQSWLQDVEDRLNVGDRSEALRSWREANTLALSLPAGFSNPEVEAKLHELRVKID